MPKGTCEHCERQFEYEIYHCGLSDCSYAYCGQCGMVAILSMWDERWPNLPNFEVRKEICLAMESHLKPCECGGFFKKGNNPRCPNCHKPLSAELAASYIEKNAPGARKKWFWQSQKNWRWQRSWNGLYCVEVEGRSVHNNFSETTAMNAQEALS